MPLKFRHHGKDYLHFYPTGYTRTGSPIKYRVSTQAAKRYSADLKRCLRLLDDHYIAYEGATNDITRRMHLVNLNQTFYECAQIMGLTTAQLKEKWSKHWQSRH